jgi:hypothetical protein
VEYNSAEIEKRTGVKNMTALTCPQAGFTGKGQGKNDSSQRLA